MDKQPRWLGFKIERTWRNRNPDYACEGWCRVGLGPATFYRLPIEEIDGTWSLYSDYGHNPEDWAPDEMLDDFDLAELEQIEVQVNRLLADLTL